MASKISKKKSKESTSQSKELAGGGIDRSVPQNPSGGMPPGSPSTGDLNFAYGSKTLNEYIEKMYKISIKIGEGLPEGTQEKVKELTESLENIVSILETLETSQGGADSASQNEIVKTWNFFYDLGNRKKEIGDLKAAIENYEKSILSNRGQFWAYNKIAECYKEQILDGEGKINKKHADAARLAYIKARENLKNARRTVTSEDKFWLYYNLAELRRKTGKDFPSGINILRNAVRNYEEAKEFSKSLGEPEFWVLYNLGESNRLIFKYHKKKGNKSERYRRENRREMSKRRKSAIKFYKDAESKINKLPEDKQQFRFWTPYYIGSLYASKRGIGSRLRDMGDRLDCQEDIGDKAISNLRRGAEDMKQAIDYLSKAMKYISLQNKHSKKDLVDKISKIL